MAEDPDSDPQPDYQYIKESITVESPHPVLDLVEGKERPIPAPDHELTLVSEDGDFVYGVRFDAFQHCPVLRACVLDQYRANNAPPRLVGIDPVKCPMYVRYLLCIIQFCQTGLLNVQDWSMPELWQLGLLCLKYDGHYTNNHKVPKPSLLDQACSALDAKIASYQDESEFRYHMNVPDYSKFTDTEQRAVELTTEWTHYQPYPPPAVSDCD